MAFNEAPVFVNACYAVKCDKCGKTTWKGCGQHVESVSHIFHSLSTCPHHHRVAPFSRSRCYFFPQSVLILFLSKSPPSLSAFCVFFPFVLCTGRSGSLGSIRTVVPQIYRRPCYPGHSCSHQVYFLQVMANVKEENKCVCPR
ncbi:hypothetical protein F5I97DRAFT_1888400 [Phlebopus sp. FC_14]|nr:hypothetical protein F5I97DRAFT_1888400 [Phlebopus sp. FC_14]